MSFTCEQCSKSFETNEALKNHALSTRHNPHSLFSATPGCGRQFGNENALNSHKYATGHNTVSCTHPGCLKTFGSTNAMQAHVNSGIHTRKESAAKSVKASSSSISVPISREPKTRPKAAIAVSTKVQVPKAPLQASPDIAHLTDRYKGLQLHQDTTTTVNSLLTPPTSIDYHVLTNSAIVPLAPSIIPQSEHLLTLVALRNRSHYKSLLMRHGYLKSSFPFSPRYSPSGPKRAAICIDCEMVAVTGNRSELAYISAIDFLTGEILINRPVQPRDEVIDWRTSVTGLTSEVMLTAAMSGAALFGWETARAELWKFIDDKTVIIGHSLQYDFKVLRMRHRCVVDSQIMCHEAVGVRNGNHFGLKALCQELLNMNIQLGPHNALEDAFAAREVVLWCISNVEALENWAEKKAKASTAAKASKQLKKGKGKGRLAAKPSKQAYRVEEDSESEGEILRWEDIGDEFGDADCDPWSD